MEPIEQQKSTLECKFTYKTDSLKSQKNIADIFKDDGISIEFQTDTLDSETVQSIMNQVAEQLDESKIYGSGSEGEIYKISICDKYGKKKDLLIAKKRFDNKPNNEIEIHKKISKLTQEGDMVQVPKLRGIFEHNGYNYIIMDFIEGKTLYHMIVEAILKKQANLMISNSKHKQDYERNEIADNVAVIKKMIESAKSDEQIANIFLRFCKQNREKMDAMYNNSHLLNIKLFGNKEGRQKKEAIQNFINMIHRNGLYHRDLHEKNIIFGDDGKIYIIDFGKSIFKDPKSGKPSKSEIYEEQAGELIGRYCDDEDIISIISGLIKSKDDEESEALSQKSIEEEKKLTSGDMIIKYIDIKKLKSKTLINKINKLFGGFEEFKKWVNKEEKSKITITSLTGGIEDYDLLLLLFSQTKENLENLLNVEIPKKKNFDIEKIKQIWIDKYGKEDRDNLYGNTNDIDEKIKKLFEVTKKMRNKENGYEKYYKKMDFIRDLKPLINIIKNLIEIQKVETYLNAINNALK